MTGLEVAGYIILGLSGLVSVILMYCGRGWSASIVFLYLFAYQAMEMGLKWVGQFSDLPYIAFALAINATFFYIFLNKKRHILALIVGFDTIYAGSNLWLIQSGVNYLDTAYGHVGVAVSILLLIAGADHGRRYRNYPDGDIWNISLEGLVRALSFGKRAKN